MAVLERCVVQCPACGTSGMPAAAQGQHSPPLSCHLPGHMTRGRGLNIIIPPGHPSVRSPGLPSLLPCDFSPCSVMRDQGINVIMISQASSEHSVCFAVKSADAEQALAALRVR